jgi:hypothetical protein
VNRLWGWSMASGDLSIEMQWIRQCTKPEEIREEDNVDVMGTGAGVLTINQR